MNRSYIVLYSQKFKDYLKIIPDCSQVPKDWFLSSTTASLKRFQFTPSFTLCHGGFLLLLKCRIIYLVSFKGDIKIPPQPTQTCIMSTSPIHFLIYFCRTHLFTSYLTLKLHTFTLNDSLNHWINPLCKNNLLLY